MPKVLIATEKPFAAEAVNKIKAELEAAKYDYEFLENYTEAAQFHAAVADVDGLIIRSDIVDEAVFNAAKNLKIVVRAGAGYDNIDLKAATAHNVVAMNTPVRTQTQLPSCSGNDDLHGQRHTTASPAQNFAERRSPSTVMAGCPVSWPIWLKAWE